MTNSYPRPSLPSLLAAVALVIFYTQAAVAQDAPRPTPVNPTPTETAAPAKGETANAQEAPSVAKDPAAAPTQAKPADGAPEKCACESPDEPDPASSRLESATGQGSQLFASASVTPKSVAPELFPRVTLRDEQTTGTQQQTGATAAPQWTPLTNEEKMKRAARNAFFSPIGVGRVLISSAITQYNEDDQPHKTRGDEFADFGTRFAIRYSRRATRTLFGSGVYPVLFNQDPRYDRAPEGKGFAYRAAHAVSRVFVQRGDSGKLQPAASRWAGSLSASALSNLWERSTPGHDRIGADATFRRFANSFVNDSINFLFVEFWPDIAKIFGR
ncbi:MAG TPA: hypothetical protein VK421_09340 [Pyrinomonadaceae bacterium]|nr:hypothetical protein [Pyrinomonadaceae bacterium]